MKARVLNNFIDNKIIVAFSEQKTIDEVIDVLKERIEKTESMVKIRPEYRAYLLNFIEKRISDIQKISSMEIFETLKTNKIIKLINLKDKINGIDYDKDVQSIDMADNNIHYPEYPLV